MATRSQANDFGAQAAATITPSVAATTSNTVRAGDREHDREEACGQRERKHEQACTALRLPSPQQRKREQRQPMRRRRQRIE